MYEGYVNIREHAGTGLVDRHSSTVKLSVIQRLTRVNKQIYSNNVQMLHFYCIGHNKFLCIVTQVKWNCLKQEFTGVNKNLHK